MNCRFNAVIALFASGMIGTVQADEPKPAAMAPAPSDVQKAAQRGLEFLKKDAEKWREEHRCSTCHHGTMTVWAFSEAKSQGYAIAPDDLADVAKWTKERLATIQKPRDARPGWNMLNTPALYLALMAQAVPGQNAVSADDVLRIDDHLVRHQEANGSWAWSIAPAGNRPPPFFESDEVVTLLANSALRKYDPAGSEAKTAARQSREKAAAWLAKSKPTDTTQALTLGLLVDVLAGIPAATLQPKIDAILARQKKDSGWAQLKEMESDAYATGQVLYVLNLAGMKNDRAEIQRGLMFLIGTQREDGSWPMIPRAHPTAKPGKNLQPITYFGSAWATLALMRSVPK